MATPPDFTAGSALTAAQMNQAGLWRITSGTFTGITTGNPLDVNSVFSSDYTNYVLHLRAKATSGNTDVRLRMRTVAAQENGGVYNHGWGGSWVAGGPTYNWGAYYTTNPFAPDTSWFAGMFPAGGYSGTSRLEIYSPNAARQTRLTGQSYTDYTGVYNVAIHGAGEVSTSTQYTGFRIFPVAGTIEGEYTLYGYND